MHYRYLHQPGALSTEPSEELTEEAVSSLLLEDWKPPSERTRPNRDWRKKDLKTLPIPQSVLDLVPASIARENNVLPVSDDGEVLVIACSDEDHLALKDKLTFILNRKIEFVRGRTSDIAEAIDRKYRPEYLSSVDSMITEFTESAIDFTAAEAGVDLSSVEAYSLDDAMEPRDSSGRLAALRRDKIRGGRVREFKGPETEDSQRTGRTAMFWYTVEEGERVLRTHWNGTKDLIVGPERVWAGLSRFEKLRHHVAHPGEFLIVRYRDGTQEHLPGPAEIWFDPRVHEQIECEECLQISAKEAVVVYSRDESGEAPATTRRILFGPALFVPQPGEWLHRFSWHASKGGHLGVEKQPNALVFQKLWLMPDQMYHDVTDVRTADNAVLRIRLMIFFELVEIERMLDETHDPIGDFVNAATADVVGFTGKHDFESFKQNTDQLNELATYKTLTQRAEQIGYRINNVVYRGYGAAESLQKMHDQAIEARTRLQLDRATEEQTQDLENYRLESQLSRAAKRRAEQVSEVRHDLELNREKQEAELKQQQARKEFLRTQQAADARLQEEISARQNEMRVTHLRQLREMNVDLTSYLTQSRADQVIEFRGDSQMPHVHLDSVRALTNGRQSEGAKEAQPS